MNDAPRRNRKWPRRALWLALALVAAAALVAAIHTPPVRRYALRRAVATLEDRFQIHLAARDLRYDLLALRVTLFDVRVAAAAQPGAPFLEARRLTVQLPRSAVLGPFAIDSVQVDGGRVRIVRGPDGRSNLPEGGNEGPEPGPLRLGRFTAPALSVEFTDAASRTSLHLPALDLEIGREPRRVRLAEPGRLTRGGVGTRIHELQGRWVFDGRHLQIDAMHVRTDELSLDLDGRVALLVSAPNLDLEVTGQADVRRLSAWADLESSPEGSLQIRGAVRGALAAPIAEATLRSSTLRWEGIAARDLEAVTRVDATTVRVASVGATIAGGRLTGSADLPLDARGTARVDASWNAVDLEALSRMLGVTAAPRPAGRADVTMQAAGPGLDPRAWRVGAVVVTRGGRTAPGRLAFDGRADLRIDRGRWRLRAAERVADLPLSVALDGRLEFDAMRRSTIRGGVSLAAVPVRQVLEALRRAGMDLQEIAEIEGTFAAEAVVGGTFSAPTLRLRGDAHAEEVGGLAPGTPLRGPASVRFAGDLGHVRVEASLPALSAAATAVIVPRAPFDAVLDATVADGDVAALVRGLDPGVPIHGRVSASIHAKGVLTAFAAARATVDVTDLEVRVGELPVRLAQPARFSYANRILDVASLEMMAADVRLSAAGGIAIEDRTESTPSSRSGAGGPARPAPSLLVTAAGDLEQFAAAAAATTLVQMPDVAGTGPAAFLARVTGSLARPQVAADLELGPGTLRAGDLPPATGIHLRAHSNGESVELRELRGDWQGSRVVASGRAPVAWAGLGAGGAPAGTSSSSEGDGVGGRPSEAVLEARLTSVTPAVLAPFVEADTLSQIAGSIDASLRLEAQAPALDAVTGELRLDRMDVRIADLPVAQREPTRITLAGGFARIAAWEWTGQGGRVGLQGQLRLSDRQAALLADGRFDLRMLTPFTRDAGLTVSGSLEPRLSITGALDAPRVDGVAAITGGELRFLEPRIVATGLDGRIVLAATRAQLTTLAGTINGGTLSATGAIEYGAQAPVAADGALEVRGMALEFPEGLRSELNADLAMAVAVPPGEEAAPSGRATGTITVLRGAYREPMAVAAGLLAQLRTRRLAAAAAPAEPALVDALAVDIRVLTEEDLVVDNNYGRLQLGADLRVGGTAAAPSLGGRAMLREGGQLFLGRNTYTIETGTVDFVNPAAIEPEVNLTAYTRAGGEDISLTLKGTAERPEIELRSTSRPELGQADVASLLLTGRRLEDISGDEAEIVTEQALAYLSGDVLGFASRVVGLDTLRLGGADAASRDASAVAGELDPTARLTFGKSIGRNLDVTLSQSLRDGDAQTWILDYRLRRQLELRFVSNDEDLRSYEFRHDVSFGGAPAARTLPRVTRLQPTIERVAIVGLAAVPEERVRGVLRLEAGDDFEFSEWQRDRDRVEALLVDAGFYEARVAARRAGDPVTLTYAVTEGPRTAIAVTGHHLDESTVSAIRGAWRVAVFDEFLIEEVEALVRSALARQGYVLPSVAAAFERAGTAKTLALRIDPGPHTPARRVRFEGADAGLTAALEAWAAAGADGANAVENPGGFARALTAFLRSGGHLRAAVAVGTPRVEGGEAVIPVTVDAGPAFAVGAVHAEGARHLDPATVRAAVLLDEGGPFDPAALEAGRDRLRVRYRRDGFAAARVDTRVDVNDATRTVDVTFIVAEGPRQVVAEVDVQGRRAIDEDVIRRALDLSVGEPVGADAWLQSRRRLFQTGLFRRVDVAPEPIGDPTSVQPMRARVIVEEWPALRLRYGFQVAEERPEGEVEGRDLVPGLSADLTRRTLFGRAATAGAALDLQRRERRGRAFLTAPTMFGLPIESSLVLERSREEPASLTLVTDRTGVSWEQRVRTSPALRLSYAYRFERNHTFDTRPPLDPTAPVFDLTVPIGRLNAAAAFDTRDDPADSTRGLLVSASVDYAAASLGSRIRFARMLAQAYAFRTWRGVVLASAARVGAAAGLGGDELILSERFFAGGSRTVRGVADDALGPRDFLGEAAGGEGLVVLNQEARFPICRWLRGVAFADAGNVFANLSDLTPADLTASWGAGLRLSTPFTLLRVDYGRLFRPGPDDRSGRWTFGIGQAF